MMPIDYHNPNENWMDHDHKDLTDKERMRIGCWSAAGYVIAIIVAMALCFMLNSCTTTQYVPVTEYRTDTLIHTKHHRDSVWLHDSISVKEKGDTIRIEKWHTKYIEREVHDTIYQAKRDSIPVPYEVIKEVPAKLSKTQNGLMKLGILTLMAAVIFGAFWLKKTFRL